MNSRPHIASAQAAAVESAAPMNGAGWMMNDADQDTRARDNTARDNTRQGIASLEIGLHLLDAIAAAAQPPSLKMLAEQLQLSPSRLHKYLVSLQRLGYVQQINGSRYALGTAALTLGISALRRIDPIQLAFDAAEQLHAQIDRTVSVTIWNGSAPLVIKWLDASRPVAVNVRLGTELSPFFSASGRLFLAYLPEARREEMLTAFYRQPPALPRQRGDTLSLERFRAHLEQIRADNLCAFYGDFLPDINVLSAAIFDINGRIPAVISLMGLNGDTDVEQGGLNQRLLSACVDRVTAQICGHAGD